MIKKTKKCIVFLLLFLLSFPCNLNLNHVSIKNKIKYSNNYQAYYPKRTENTFNCSKYSVEYALKNGGYEQIACYDNYTDAVSKMNSETFTLDKTPIIFDAIKSKITNMRGGIISTSNVPSNININVYPNSNTTSAITYFNGQYSGEMAFVDSNISNGGRIKGMIAGYTGWINENINGNEIYLVPVSKITNHSKYFAKNDGTYNALYHTYTYGGDITTSSSIGIASASFNKDTNYYSFDGNNFYTDLVTMYNDYRAENTNNAIIKNFYNYYQYLPFRSKTNYKTNDFKSYLESLGKTNNQIYKNIDGFIKTQNTSGINSAMELVLGIHESGWGESSIANSKNNLFGLGADDSNPFGNAYYFPSVSFGIEYHSKRTIGDGYLDSGYNYISPEHKGDSRYFGSYFGNKKGGLNVKYASDPYWGEKIAGHYYRMDKYLGFKDYNQYKLLIKNNNQIYNLSYIDDRNGKYAYQTNNSGGYTVLVESFLVVSENDSYYTVMSNVPVATSKVTPMGYYMKSRGVNSPDTFDYKTFTPNIETVIGKVHFGIDYDWEKSNLYLSKSYSLIATGASTYTNPKDIGKTSTNDNTTVTPPTTPTIPTPTPVIPKPTPVTPKPVVTVTINYGDANGDSKITAADYVLIKNHILGKSSLSGNYLKAADYNKDSKITAADYVLVKNHILGK